jgi:preprotein translocase subunit SecD
MLYFEGWKKALVIGTLLLGVLFALPNLFFERTDAASRARAEIARIEQRGDAVPATLVEAARRWPSWLPGRPMNLGLDLRGGAHVLVEVRIDEVYAEKLIALWPEAREALRARRDVVGPFRQVEGDPLALTIRLGEPTPAGIDAAAAALRALAQPVQSGAMGPGGDDISVEAGADGVLRVRLSEAEQATLLERTMAQSLEIVRRRIDEAGTREPTIQRQGRRRILVQVPGIGSADELLALLGETAKLTFHEVVGQTADPNADPGPGNMLVEDAEEPGAFYIVPRRPTVSGENLVDASGGFDQDGQPAVNFRFDTTGARQFGDYTRQNVGRIFAIVLDDKVISAPRIREPILGGSGIISGSFTTESANELAVLLRAGALPAPLAVIEERSVGPDLGADSIRAGTIAVVVASVLVLAYMVIYYGVFGIFANIALVLNVVMILDLMTLLGATLTLPGIAGIVLTIGQAVDSNVLIYERIREEARVGRTPFAAINAGFGEATRTIVDANLTTLIAAAALFQFGSGPVKGFAVTLAFGIMTNMFTAVTFTRAIVELWYRRTRPAVIPL